MAPSEATLIANQGVYFPSLHELVTAILDVGVGQWMMLAGLIIWLVTLTRPLSDIDQRDHITGITFTAFFLALGTFLIIALPAEADAKTKSFASSFAIFGLMLAVTALRWLWQRQDRIDDFKRRNSQQKEGPGV